MSPYICSDSINITGSLSLIEDFNRPFASYGFEGTITFKPGQFANQLSKAWEWVAPSWPADPVGPLKTIGHENWPPDIILIFEALLIIWSIPTNAKLNVINSMIGLLPVMVEPTPTPEKPNSEIGVSITRLSPNSSNIPFEALYAPLYSATSSPIRYIDLSSRISSDIASAIASLNCTVFIDIFI